MYEIKVPEKAVFTHLVSVEGWKGPVECDFETMVCFWFANSPLVRSPASNTKLFLDAAQDLRGKQPTETWVVSDAAHELLVKIAQAYPFNGETTFYMLPMTLAITGAPKIKAPPAPQSP